MEIMYALVIYIGGKVGLSSKESTFRFSLNQYFWAPSGGKFGRVWVGVLQKPPLSDMMQAVFLLVLLKSC